MAENTTAMKKVCRKEADAGTKVLDPQGVSRLAPRQQPGQGGYRLNGEVHKVYKSITAPGVSPYPFSAKYAPAMNGSTVSAAAIAVIRGE